MQLTVSLLTSNTCKDPEIGLLEDVHDTHSLLPEREVNVEYRLSSGNCI